VCSDALQVGIHSVHRNANTSMLWRQYLCVCGNNAFVQFSLFCVCENLAIPLAFVEKKMMMITVYKWYLSILALNICDFSLSIFCSLLWLMLTVNRYLQKDWCTCLVIHVLWLIFCIAHCTIYIIMHWIHFIVVEIRMTEGHILLEQIFRLASMLRLSDECWFFLSKYLCAINVSKSVYPIHLSLWM